MSEKICSNCGRPNSADMSFCLNCGNSLASSGISGSQQDSAPTVFINPKTTDANFQPANFQPLTPNQPPVTPKKSKTGLWLAILGGGGLIVLLVLGAVAGIVALNWDEITGKKPTPKYSPTPTYSPAPINNSSTPTLSPSPVKTNTTPNVPNTTHNATTPTNTSAPRATFNRVWVDYNVTENGRTGMRIHAKFTTYNMKGLDSHMAIYFSYRNGERLKTDNKAYASTEGQVAIFRPMKPAFEPAEFADLTVFMPYNELNLGKGKFALQMDVDIIYDKGGLIQHLTFYDFDYSA